MDNDNYYYTVDGRTVGPVLFKDIRQMVEAGALRPDVFVIKAGDSQWVSYSAVAAGAGAPAPQTSQTFQYAQQAPQAPSPFVVGLDDAFKTFKNIALNPISSMSESYQGLGPQKAMWVGIIYGIISGLSLLIPISQVPNSFHNQVFEIIIKTLIIGALPFGALWLCSLATRGIFGIKGTAGQDVFLAGVTVLPFVAINCLSFFMSTTSLDSNLFFGGIVVGLLALSTCILFSGQIKILGLSEKVATWMTPVFLIITIGVTGECIYQMVIRSIASTIYRY